MKALYRTIVFIFLFMSCSLAFSQELNLDDPNIIYKTPDGTILSKQEVEDIKEKKTPYKTYNKQLSNGKTVVYIIKGEVLNEARQKQSESQDWINKWTGKSLPKFSLKNLNGETTTNNTIKGKVTVLNFWYTKCKPCIKEMPELNKLVDKYKSQNVVFFAPSIDDENELKDFVTAKENNFKYQILSNSRALNYETGLNFYPTHMVIDTKGVIRDIIIGFDENIKEKLSQSINNLLK